MKYKAIFTLMMSHSVFANTELICDTNNILYSVPLQAPRVTELREGSAIFSFVVTENGNVENIELIESVGDNRWVASMKTALAERKYKTSDSEYKQVCELSAKFDN